MRFKGFHIPLLSIVFTLILSFQGPARAQTEGIEADARSKALREVEQTQQISEGLRIAWRELDKIRHAAMHPTKKPWAGDRLAKLAQHLELMEAEVWQLDDLSLLRKYKGLARLAQTLQDELEQGMVFSPKGERPRGLQLGSRCTEAPELVEGAWALQAVSKNLSTGESGSVSGWLRFTAPFEGRFTLQTRRSSTDTHLEIFGDCGSASIARSDDAYGLTAALSFSSAEDQVWWVRVQAQGSGISVLDVHGLSAEQESYLRRARAEGKLAAGDPEQDLGAGSHLGSGTLSGQVTAQDDGSPLPGIRVELFRDSGSWQYQGSTTSDANGDYAFSGLEAGDYRLVTDQYLPDSEYLNQVYPGAHCFEACNLEDGETVVLDGVSEVSGIDLALLRGSTISGWVRDAGQIGIHSARVEVFDSAQTLFRSDYTDSAGRYSIHGLGFGGDYRLKVESSDYRDELWQDVDCQGGCDLSTGDVLTVGPAQDAQGVDFELIRLGSISGRITDDQTGGPISSARVTAYNSAGDSMGSDFANSDGEYLIGGLPAGDYYLVAGESGYVDEAWDNTPCEPCDPTTSTPIAVTHDSDIPGIDLALQPYGSITGRITSATDDRPLLSLWVEAYDAAGAMVSRARSLSHGDYTLFLPPGSYFVAVPDVDDHYAEVWNDRRCVDDICDVLAGDSVAVGVGAEVPDIDFSLSEKAKISGVVSASEGGASLSAWMTVYDSSGQPLQTAYANGFGEYVVEGLDAGTYYLKASESGYLTEVYDDVLCHSGCDPTTGMGLVVTEGQHLQGIDLALDRLGRVFGSVTDLGTGLPLGDEGVFNTRLTFYDELGDYFTAVSTNAEGFYSVTNIRPGTYYLRVTRDGYIAKLWQSVDCFPASGSHMCDVTTGDPIVVAGNSAIEANVALDRGGSISGTVSSADAALSLGVGSLDGIPAQVQIYDETGAFINSRYATIPESWSISGLITGNYFVKTTIFHPRYMDELWDGIPCEENLGFNCAVTSGTPVAVTRGSETSGIDFTLDVVGTISGRLTQNGTGEPIPYGLVFAYDAAGSTFTNTQADADGYYTLEGLGAGDFYVSTRYNSNYMDWVYGGGMCETDCEPLSGTPLSLTLYQHLDGIDLALDPSRAVRGTVTSLSTGAPIPGVAIDFWRSDGTLWSTSVTGPDGSFENRGLHDGTYYISTDNGSGFVDQIWSGVSCPDGSAHDGQCDVIFLGTLIEVGEEHPVRVLPFSLANDEVLFRSGFENGLLGWTVVP